MESADDLAKIKPAQTVSYPRQLSAAHLHVGDVVLEENVGGDFEAFLGIEAGGLDLGVEAEAGGPHRFRSVTDAFLQDAPAEARSTHVGGGDDAAYLDCARLAGLPKEPQVSLDTAGARTGTKAGTRATAITRVTLGIKQMHGIIVLAVGFRIWAVLLDDEDGLPEPEDFVDEQTRAESAEEAERRKKESDWDNRFTNS